MALNTDEFVVEYKGKPPVQSYEERKEMIDACRYVDKVMRNIGGKDSRPSLLASGCDVVVNGSDWTREALMLQMGLSEVFLNKNHIRIELCPLVRVFSTTELKERVNENRCLSV